MAETGSKLLRLTLSNVIDQVLHRVNVQKTIVNFDFVHLLQVVSQFSHAHRVDTEHDQAVIQLSISTEFGAKLI